MTCIYPDLINRSNRSSITNRSVFEHSSIDEFG